jgi:hypothetical protein
MHGRLPLRLFGGVTTSTAPFKRSRPLDITLALRAAPVTIERGGKRPEVTLVNNSVTL